MIALAELVGAHAVAVLLMVALLTLLVTSLVWRLVQEYSSSVWRLLTILIERTRALVNEHSPALWVPSPLARAFGIARYLGVQAVISIALSIAAFGVFFEIADEIGADEDLAQFDVALSESLREHVSPDTLWFFARITHLGDSAFLIALASAIALILLWRRQWLHAGAWIVSTSLGGVLNWVLKALFERVRPEHDHTSMAVTGWSFPSGHASGSFIVYGLLGYLLVRHTPQAWHVPTVLIAVLLVVFVGFSRVILQVHYLSDVLAGYAFAVAWVALWIAGLEAMKSTASSNSPSVVQ